jgi:octaprenyl-diphosphate synthase
MAQEEDFGKAIGKDLEEGKVTLPLIYTLSRCSQTEKDMIKTTIENKSFTPETIRKIFALIQKSGGIDYSLNRAQTFIRESISDLEGFQDSPAKDHLRTVAEYVLSREK